MGQVSVESILAGVAQGHQLRWAEDFCKKHEGSTENCVQVFRDHTEDARCCQKLVGMRIHTNDASPKLDELLERVQAYGDAFPTLMKSSILERRFAMYLDTHCLSDFLRAVQPWSVAGGNISFNPTRPLLVAIEATVIERASFFRNKIMSLLTTLVRRGGAHEEEMADTISKILVFLEESDINEDFDDEADNNESIKAIDAVASCCEALRLLLLIDKSTLASCHLNAAPTLCEILQARTMRGVAAASNPYHALSTELGKCTDFYEDKIVAFEKNLTKYRHHLPRIEKALQAMTSNHQKTNVELNDTYCGFIREVLLPAQTELHHEHTSALDQKLSVACASLFHSILKDIRQDSQGQGSVDLLTHGRSFRDLLALCGRAFPGLAREHWSNFEDELRWVQDQRSEKVIDDLIELTEGIAATRT